MGKMQCDRETLAAVQKFSRAVLKRIWEKEELLVTLGDEAVIAGCLVRNLAGHLDELMLHLPPEERAEWERRASELCDRLP